MPQPVTCVLFDRPDGESFLAEAALASAIPFALTPEASTPLVERGTAFQEPTASALIWANARATAQTSRLIAQVREAGQGKLSTAGLFALERMLRHPCATGARLWSLLRGKEAIAYRIDEGWRTTTVRREAYTHLVQRMGERKPDHSFLPEEDWVAGAFGWLAHAFAIYRGLKGAVVYNTIRKHFARFAAEFHERDKSVSQFGMEGVFSPKRADAIKLFKSLFERPAEKFGKIVTTLDIAAYHQGEHAALALLDGIEDPVIRPAIEAQRQTIAHRVATTEGYAAWLGKIFAWHKPRAVFLNGMSTGLNIAMAQAAKKQAVPVMLVGHCSVGEGPLASPLPKAALKAWYEEICASPYADVQVVQSPHAEASVRALDPAARCLRVKPIIWGSARVTPSQPADSDEFVILHAGNFQPWPFYLPFSSECSLEYVWRIIEVAQAVKQVPRCKLVIRMKPGHEHKAECLLESVKCRLPENLNYCFSTEGSFYDALAGADLLMSSTSTVIEEALLNRIPVLLRSGSGVKPFLPARATAPTAADRSPVYTVNDAQELPGMISAIAQAHFRKPLTDEELRPHCWGEEAMTTGQFADFLAQGKLPDYLKTTARAA